MSLQTTPAIGASGPAHARRVFIASHSTPPPMSGPPDYFERFLARSGADIVRIDHPLDRYAGRVSLLRHGATRIREWRRSDRGPLSLLWDFVVTIRAASASDAEVAIGVSNFDTLSILCSRWLRFRRSPRVVYFAVDYSEDRFANRLMNWIYQQVERSVLRNAEVVVSNTRRAEAKRIELGLDRRKSVVIPNGVRLEDPEFPPKSIRKDCFVFVGSVTREHGLYEMVAALKPLIGQLVIIGQGEDWERVVRLCEEERIPHELHHKWPHQDVMRLLREFEGIGLAPYNRDSKWTYYSSPLKISEYIASGVPVITSSVPEIADTIRSEGLGVVYDEIDFERLKQALDALDLTDFHLRAKQFYARFNSDHLYAQVQL